MMEPASEKSLYLIRLLDPIVGADQHVAPSKETAYQFYLNVGMANHNLYLFLKRHDMANMTYIRSSLAAYGKARRIGTTPIDRATAEGLGAALLASSGKTKIAAKKFRRVESVLLPEAFTPACALATYYGAQGDSGRAIKALRAAYARSPVATKHWLRITDDFMTIKQDQAFAALLREWDVFAPGRPWAIPTPKPPARKVKKRR
ncbi:MAG: hypothetical protein HYV03_00800 [Deltaproteobacteria bacterium]|nr:hypothetical protein [Deltaproteobacteria bacterium]